MGSAASKAAEIKDKAEAEKDKAKNQASETLQVLMQDTENRLKAFKASVLDQKVADAQGYVAVDQVISELNDVYVATKQDASSLKQGVNEMIGDLFQGNVKQFFLQGFDTAIDVIAGQAKGDMKVSTMYKLAMNVHGTNPDISVLNVYCFNYAFKYNALVSYGESACGYCAIYGSVAPGALHVGTLNTLLNEAADKGTIPDEKFDEVRKNAIATYVNNSTIVHQPTLLSLPSMLNQKEEELVKNKSLTRKRARRS